MSVDIALFKTASPDWDGSKDLYLTAYSGRRGRRMVQLSIGNLYCCLTPKQQRTLAAYLTARASGTLDLKHKKVSP